MFPKCRQYSPRPHKVLTRNIINVSNERNTERRPSSKGNLLSASPVGSSKTEVSLPCRKGLAIGSYREPDETRCIEAPIKTEGRKT